jgi:hypothetical protein
MPSKTVYLEAANRTQDLLNVKWLLRSAGYCIASTWHEAQRPVPTEDHWNVTGLEQLQICDSLVVLCAEKGAVAPELAMMAGFALARGITVCWIGPTLRALCDFRAVRQFKTLREFQKQLVSQTHSQSTLVPNRLAA